MTILYQVLITKIATNKTKNEPIENEFKKLETLDLSYFIDKVILKKMIYNII